MTSRSSIPNHTGAAEPARRQAAHHAAAIAHDLNHVLTVVIHAAEAIERRAAGAVEQADGGSGDNECAQEIRADAAEIRRAALSGARLVARLVAGRPRRGGPVRLEAHAALEVVAGFARRMLGPAFAVEIVLAAPGCHVALEAGELDRMLLNLVANARAARPSGGRIAMRVRSEPSRRARSRGGPVRDVIFEVEDDGPGIEPAILARVFEPNFTTRADQGGRGIGLANVRAIAERRGGRVCLDSVVGRGTRCAIRLPACVPRAEPTAPSASGPAQRMVTLPPGSRGRVLLVDDEVPLLRLVARRLAASGWDVLAAESAEDALERLVPTGPRNLSAVVTDLILPGRSGAALVAELRARDAGNSLPAVIASGHPEPADADDKITARLSKPYGMAELEALLDRLVAAPRDYSTDQARL